MKTWIFVCSSLFLLLNTPTALADSFGDQPYFKTIMKSAAGKELSLFGNISDDQAEKFFSAWEKNKAAKDSEIEMYESYRLTMKPGEGSAKASLKLEKIGQGFALNKYDMAIMLDNAHGSLVEGVRSATESVEKDREDKKNRDRDKVLLLFFKKGTAPESQSFESLIRTAEFAFWVHNT